MKKIVFGILLNMISISVLAQTKEERLQMLMNAYYRLNKLNGSVLITQEGKTVLNKGYGFRDVKDSLKNDSNTVFQIGSVTKQFTAAVIMKLQEMKKLHVEDKINRYFPAYPTGDSITIKHLLTHTSGIFNYTDDRIFLQTKATAPVSKEEMFSMFKDRPLNFSPGTGWEYSNSNYILLGYIIEKICKKNYEQVVWEFIFKPLNMTSSGFDYTHLNSSNKSQGYTYITAAGGNKSTEFDSTVSFAAGGMYSSTADLYKWQKAVSSYRILKRSSFEQASTPYKNKYGYGVYIDSIYGKRLIAHGGMTFGFTSYVGRIAEDDVSIIILNNVVNYSIAQIAKDVLAILYDRPYKLPEAAKEITLPRETLNKYTGTYDLAPQFSIVVSFMNDSLFAQTPNQPKFNFHAAKEDLFFIKGIDVKVEFTKDVAGNITGLVLIEASRKTVCKKVR